MSSCSCMDIRKTSSFPCTDTMHILWLKRREKSATAIFIKIFHTKHTLSCSRKAEGEYNCIMMFFFIHFLRANLQMLFLRFHC